MRIGNAAEHQLQLDISGEFLDALSLSEQTGSDRLLSYDLWQEVSGIIGWLCDHWDEPDEGIWEVRSGRKRFTFSRLMSWVALDRAIRIADHRAFPADLSRWRRAGRPLRLDHAARMEPPAPGLRPVRGRR